MAKSKQSGAQPAQLAGKGKRFSSEYQPDPKKLQEVWDRKKRAQAIMNKILELQNMEMSELMEWKNAPNLTVMDLLLIKYVEEGLTDSKMLLDMLDRHVPKAPSTMDMQHSGFVGQVNITGNETPQELEKMRKALLV